MNRRQKIIVSVTGIFIVLLILVGLTYAYFLTQIRGNENDKSISVTTANLALVYKDGTDIVLTSEDKLIPGEFTKSKTFTVENTGNATVENYAVVIEDVVNPLDRPQDMEMTLTCTSSVTGKTCDGTSGSLPTQNEILVTNSIDEKEIQTYTITLSYVDPGVDQSSDMGKTIEGKLDIIDTHNTLDLTGTVASVSEGDYVQVNSEPRVSQIINKTFKVVGLEPGTHTVGVYSSTGTLKGSKTFTLNKSEEESVSGTTINFTDASRVATINIASDYTISISSEIVKLNVLTKGTLAYEVINNAKIAKEENSDSRTIYSPTPLTTPAAAASGSDEKTLSLSQDDYGNSYYFRGNVTDNFVNFSGMCWRVVRVQGDNTVKLVLADDENECNSAEYENSSDNKASFIARTNNGINTDRNDGNRDDYETVLNAWLNGGEVSVANWGSSWDSWGGTITRNFDEHISPTNQEKIIDNVWCIDNTEAGTKDYVDRFYENNIGQDYYSAYKRLVNDNSPTLKCDMVGTDGKGATKTTSKIGLLTADEIAFAGSTTKSDSTVNYYLMSNADGYYVTSSIGLQAISDWMCDEAGSCYGYYFSQYEIFRVENGKLNTNIESGGGHVRPSVVLKNDVLVTGSGTESDPYIVK